jgi:tetratricopeptide (TPR) repeat protein
MKNKNNSTFLIFVLILLVFNIQPCFCSDLNTMKTYFLIGDYNSCINEGEKIIANPKGQKDSDELYYLLGLSYLKVGNFLRASDIFEIIIKEYKNSKFKEDAMLGLGDVSFFLADYNKAKAQYEEILKNPKSSLKPAIYYRLSKIALKTGDTQTAEENLKKLKTEFPLSLETKNTEGFVSDKIYYTVQVGSFSNIENANNLTQVLINKNYPAFVEEAKSKDKTVYRVRVGKFAERQKAEELEKKLIVQGYPTKIFP